MSATIQSAIVRSEKMLTKSSKINAQSVRANVKNTQLNP